MINGVISLMPDEIKKIRAMYEVKKNDDAYKLLHECVIASTESTIFHQTPSERKHCSLYALVWGYIITGWDDFKQPAIERAVNKFSKSDFFNFEDFMAIDLLLASGVFKQIPDVMLRVLKDEANKSIEYFEGDLEEGQANQQPDELLSIYLIGLLINDTSLTDYVGKIFPAYIKKTLGSYESDPKNAGIFYHENCIHNAVLCSNWLSTLAWSIDRAKKYTTTQNFITGSAFELRGGKGQSIVNNFKALLPLVSDGNDGSATLLIEQFSYYTKIIGNTDLNKVVETELLASGMHKPITPTYATFYMFLNDFRRNQ